MTKKFRSESERKRIAIQKGEEMYPMTDQPAVPEEKCPWCKGVGDAKDELGYIKPCSECRGTGKRKVWGHDPNLLGEPEAPEPLREDDYMGPGCADEITDSPTKPSVGELWPDTVVGFIRKELTSVKSRDNRAFYFEELNPKYQQALLRKGGLDREKVKKFMDETNEPTFDSLFEAIESGALDVGGVK